MNERVAMERLNVMVRNLSMNLECEKKNNHQLSLTVEKLKTDVEILLKGQNMLINFLIRNQEDYKKQLTRIEIETSMLYDFQRVIYDEIVQNNFFL